MTGWQIVLALLTALSTFMGAVVGVLAWKSKTNADKRTADMDSVKVSLESLQAALVRSDAERAQLRTDLTAEEQASIELRREIQELHSRIAAMERRHSGHLAILRNEIRRLGGNPDVPLEAK